MLEEQIAAGRRITYRDLVLQAIALNKSKTGPLRGESGRYINSFQILWLITKVRRTPQL
jgi:hypothetical protein